MNGEILFLAHRAPYPPDRGDRIRSWNIVKALFGMAPVHVLALDDATEGTAIANSPLASAAASLSLHPPPARLAALTRALASGRPASVEAFRSASLRTAFGHLLATRPIAAIYAYSGQMAQYVPPLSGVRFVMDFVDVDSAKFAQYGEAGGLSGIANRIEARRLRAFECATAMRADACLFVSEAEAALFRRRTGIGGDTVRVLENGVDCRHFSPDFMPGPVDVPGSPLIVFTGQMDYRPNEEAMRGFVRHQLPAIRAIHPNATLAIVGRNPSLETRLLARQPGVIVTGAVPDTRDWLALADLVVAPLSLARGVQNKVLEAMAMGRAVVASPAAAEGIDAEHGRELVVADGAGAAIALLQDDERRAAIGLAARRRIEARYGWDRQLAVLPAIMGLAP